jgi:hypothetical protein
MHLDSNTSRIKSTASNTQILTQLTDQLQTVGLSELIILSVTLWAWSSGPSDIWRGKPDRSSKICNIYQCP